MFTKSGKPDILVFGAVIILLSIGLVMVFSASSVMGFSEHRDPYHYVRRQSILAVVGLVALFVLMKVDYHIFKPLALPGLIVSFALLVAVILIGQDTGGATRWIRIGSFNLQPSESAKVAMVNYAAVYISTKRERVRRFLSGLMPVIVILAGQFILIMLEPDFGTGVALVFAVIVVLFAGGPSWAACIFRYRAAPILWKVMTLKEYRIKRLFAFLDPWADPTDTGGILSVLTGYRIGRIIWSRAWKE